MESVSKLFQIVRDPRNGLLSILQLTFVEIISRAHDAPLAPLDENEALKVCQTVEDRMKVRCAGFLEVSGCVYDPACRDWRNPKIKGKVQFLHTGQRETISRSQTSEP